MRMSVSEWLRATESNDGIEAMVWDWWKNDLIDAVEYFTLCDCDNWEELATAMEALGL